MVRTGGRGGEVGGASCARGGGIRRMVTVGVIALGSLAVAGCTSARDTLGTNSSPCFRALALGEDAVHDRGVFVGVRLVSAATLKKIPRVDGVLSQRSSTPLHNVCAVGYRGTFRSTQVERPAGRVSASGVGHFAIVVVSTPQNVLLATFVLEKEPVRFRHLALGVLHGPAPGPSSGVG
ncbi:MAG TPA: hypothetical protein VK215_00775 [Acidimicrobiales bacterium]|nr:hypothetical protein [Acidimicrobiales bacterium]